MHAHLMRLAPVLETGVVDQVCAAVFSSDDGIVTLGALRRVAHRLISPLAICAQDVHAAVVVGFGAKVQLVAGEDRVDAFGIGVGLLAAFIAEVVLAKKYGKLQPKDEEKNDNTTKE